MRTVLIPTKLDPLAANLLTDKGYAVTQDAKTPLLELAPAHAEVEVLIVRSEEVTPAVIDAFPKLRLVVRAGQFLNGTALSNGGERLRLEAPGGVIIKDFEYDDVAPWPSVQAAAGELAATAPASGTSSTV